MAQLQKETKSSKKKSGGKSKKYKSGYLSKKQKSNNKVDDKNKSYELDQFGDPDIEQEDDDTQYTYPDQTQNKNSFQKISTKKIIGIALSFIILGVILYKILQPEKINFVFIGDEVSISDSDRNYQNYRYRGSNNKDKVKQGVVPYVLHKTYRNLQNDNIVFYNKGVENENIEQLNKVIQNISGLNPYLLTMITGLSDIIKVVDIETQQLDSKSMDIIKTGNQTHIISEKGLEYIKQFKKDYVKNLENIFEQNPEVILIIGEPFSFQGEKTSQNPIFNFIKKEVQKEIKDLVYQYIKDNNNDIESQIVYIEFQELLDIKLDDINGMVDFFTKDGITPSPYLLDHIAGIWYKYVATYLKQLQ